MKFDAVLAKNDIARELRNHYQLGEALNLEFIEECLQTIERYLEPTNQPSVTDITNDAKVVL